MQIFYASDHAQHNPPHEFLEGHLVGYNEVPARAEMIVGALREAQLGPILLPADVGLAPIAAIHTAEYIEHLRTIYPRYVAAGGNPAAALPSTFATRELSRRSASPLAEIGYFAFDVSAPITAQTFAAAVQSAHTALAGATLLTQGEQLTYALCRPPGHHAHADLMGGFCYFNNAAIAAQALLTNASAGVRAAILDIDVHHGNGTQAIFYERSDVLTVSIHGSPEWEYPYFAGYADETGRAGGEGCNRNFPLEQGVSDEQYLAVLHQALDAIAKYAPTYLVLSAGFDTFAGDPLGKFRLSSQAYPAIGAAIAQLQLPTLVVQEGGYTVAALGENVVGLLQGLAY